MRNLLHLVAGVALGLALGGGVIFIASALLPAEWALVVAVLMGLFAAGLLIVALPFPWLDG